MAEHVRERLDPTLPRPLLRAHDDARGAVVQPGRVAGGRRPLRVEDRLQRRELLERRVAADALVGRDVADGNDLVVEAAGVLGRGGALLRAKRPGVLLLAADAELPRHGRRLLHHVLPVERGDEPVEDGVVENLTVAQPVAKAALREHVRSARHRLHPACHDDVVPTRGDHQLGDLECPDRRRADLVDRVRGNLLRDPGSDRGLSRGRLPRPCLEHLAHHDVADVLRLDAGAIEPRADRDRAKLGRGHVREAAAKAAERRANGGDDDGVGHPRSA